MWKKLCASALAIALIGLVALPTHAATATPRTLLTIADGPVQVLRGTQRLTAAEGLTLADDDIVRTTAGTRVARIEWADGRVLDLGPATDVMLASERTTPRSAELAGSTAVLARGWAKLAAGADSAARLAAPGVVAQADARGVLLLHAADDGALVAFAESRAATIALRGTGNAVPLREGQAWVRTSAAAAGALAPRHGALGDVPRALADALPRRAARFAEREVAPAAINAQDANELAAWWRAEPMWMAQVHPRAWPVATKKRAAPTRVAAKPGPRRRDAVVVPGLPLPVGGASDAAPGLGASTRLAREHVDRVALPSIAAAPLLPAAPAAPVAAAATRKPY